MKPSAETQLDFFKNSIALTKTILDLNSFKIFKHFYTVLISVYIIYMRLCICTILGVQETIVRCVSIHNGSTVDDNYCKDVHLVPVERRVCNDINCPQRYIPPQGFLSLQPPSSFNLMLLDIIRSFSEMTLLSFTWLRITPPPPLCFFFLTLN